VNQRLYRIEPHHGRRHQHGRPVHSEILVNLMRGEIRLWFYLSEPLCQRVSLDLQKPKNVLAAFAHMKPLLRRTMESLKTAGMHHHLSHRIHVVSDKPNLNHMTPPWLQQAGRHLGAKIGEWAQAQLLEYLQRNAEEFKQACASRHDGVTLVITMTRVPGMEILRELSLGKIPREFSHGGWPKGAPAFHVTQHTGYAVKTFTGLRG
jgi:hypothetical protein